MSGVSRLELFLQGHNQSISYWSNAADWPDFSLGPCVVCVVLRPSWPNSVGQSSVSVWASERTGCRSDRDAALQTERPRGSTTAHLHGRPNSARLNPQTEEALAVTPHRKLVVSQRPARRERDQNWGRTGPKWRKHANQQGVQTSQPMRKKTSQVTLVRNQKLLLETC